MRSLFNRFNPEMLNNLMNKSGNGNGNNTVGLALPYAFFHRS